MLELLLVALAGLAAAQVPSSTSSIPTITPTTPPTPDFPVCNPDDFVGLSSPWPFPDLPDQFSFTIEGNLVERNRTVVMTEYYDGYGDRGKLEYVFNDTSGFAIFDYNLGEIFLAPDLRTGDECRVYPIADNPMILNFTFGVTHRNGSVHIGSPRTFLEQLRDDSATRYVGEDMVRGIPTQRWQACFGGENISYLIDYHFAYSSWDYEGQGQNLEASEMIPLQFTLNTARLEDGEIKRIYHIYSVIDFRAGPSSVPDSVFRVPNRLACKGRFPGQPVPPVPQFFSTTTERVYSVNGGNGIRTMREFYDLPNNLYRRDFYNTQGGQFPTGAFSIIHDFDTSVQYVLRNDVINCSTQPLSMYAPFFPDVANANKQEIFQLVSPNNFFFLGSDYNYSYEGVSTIRGVEVDSWVSVRDFEQIAGAVNLTNAIYEVFFTRPGWIYTTDRSINSDPVPWRIRISGLVSVRNLTNNSTSRFSGTFVIDYFDFSVDEPGYDAFDISLCSGPDDYNTVLMLLPGQEKGVNFGQLRRNIRRSVSNYTGVKPLQIGNIQIVGENGTHVYITFHISNLTDVAEGATNSVTANMATKMLTQSLLSNSTLPFTIQLSENNTISPFLIEIGRGNRNRTSTCNTTATNNSTGCHSNFTSQLGLTDKIVAGVAVGLFLFGLLMGMVFMIVCICCVYCWKSTSTYDLKTKPVKYEKQIDDITLTT